ncbi:MAG: DUF4855 domain-containing protein [Desulfocucumaceae bacterium]
MKLKKAIFYSTTALLILLGGSIAYSEPGTPVFSDIGGSFAGEAIVRLAGQGIIQGAGGEVRPEDSISRRDFALLLAKTLGVQPVFPAVPAFSDVPRGTLESGYLEALAKLGIIMGTGKEVFGPEGKLLRQDAAVLIYRAMREEAEWFSLSERFSDKDSVSAYAVDGVAFVSGKGWMAGSGDAFYPLRELTRAEASALAVKLLETRRKQALTAFKVISPERLQLRSGETKPIVSRAAGKHQTFTPVYGTDSPEVCRALPEEALISGKQPGKGTVTVNAGYNFYTVNTEVSSARERDRVSPSVAAFYPEAELGFNYSLRQQAPDTAFQQEEKKSSPGPAEGLISKSDTWTGFLRQQGREITVDLKAPRPVTQISLEFWQNPEWAVFLPGYIKGQVSADGVTWSHLGYAYHGVSPAGQEAQSANLTLNFQPVTARYIKISFPVDIWVFARHLSVKGGTAGQNPSILALAGEGGDFAGNYMQVPGIKDILLIYTGNKSNDQIINAGDFLPLVGYRGSSGDIAGKMFDTMLFLPYHDMPCTRDSWAAYTEDLFAPGRQLAALEEAVAKMNQIPGLQGKEKVILSLPYPDASQQTFGVPGDSKEPLCFSEKSAGREKAARDRFSAVQWYYSDLMARWGSAGFKHLELAGIYWYGESIDQTVTGEKELLLNTARLVRNSGQKFFWIPYFGTKGYEDWRSYGFSHVFLQPNYYAEKAPPVDRMDSAAELARRYGLGIEIECEEDVLYSSAAYDLFGKQLKKGHQLGFDGEMTNAYYAGLVKRTLVKAARSSIPKERSIYDDLYRWISGTYN